MIPFNCLTVPLGSDNTYDLEQCLDEYTKLEDITDVDCPKCTLLRAEGQLKQMLPANATTDDNGHGTLLGSVSSGGGSPCTLLATDSEVLVGNVRLSQGSPIQLPDFRISV